MCVSEKINRFDICCFGSCVFVLMLVDIGKSFLNSGFLRVSIISRKDLPGKTR